MSDREAQTVLDFIRYEEENGRTCKIEANSEILQKIEDDRQDSIIIG